jgi:hypothetical protein
LNDPIEPFVKEAAIASEYLGCGPSTSTFHKYGAVQTLFLQTPLIVERATSLNGEESHGTNYLRL